MEENEYKEEAYWFIRYCQLRAQYIRAQKAFEDIKTSDVSILRAENLQLKNTLFQIRKDFVPEPTKRKRTYKGNNPNKKL